MRKDVLVALATVAAAMVAVVAGQAAPLVGARLTVASSPYGKTVFGPSGKVLYVFGPDRARPATATASAPQRGRRS